MKVLLISKSDWANQGYDLQECLKKVNIEALSIAKVTHHYKYRKHSTIYNNDEELKDYIKWADILIFMHSKFIDTGVDISKKKIIPFHTGSEYRQNAKEKNALFNPISSVSFCGGDVLGFGAKNEIWVQPPVNTDALKPVYERMDPEKTIVAHYPSGYKGGDIIQNCINKLTRKNFIYKTEGVVSNTKHIRRVSKCDIYIEDMQTHQEGIPLTIFGITALEAAALGKVVCTRFPMLPEYEKEFGKCGLQVTDTPEILISTMNRLLGTSDEEFMKLRKESREWVERCHSYETLGNKFKKILENL